MLLQEQGVAVWVKPKIKKLSQALGVYKFLLKMRRKLSIIVNVTKAPSIVYRKLQEVIYRKPFAMAGDLFYKKGDISSALTILEDLQDKGVPFDKKKCDFLGVLYGFLRLKEGWKVPPRQPNAGLFTRRRHLLYCLHQSVPYATNGYAVRSHGIASSLQEAGWQVAATTRPGFPWDAKVNGLNTGRHEEAVDGINYTAVAGWNLNKTPLDYYMADAADHFLREAQTHGAEVIVAASNHITGLPALVAARRLGLPFVYEVRGLWEITQASTQPDWADSERFRLMRRLEAQVASEADLIITLTEELADELVARGAVRDRIIVVPNAVDAHRFAPSGPDPEISRELGLEPGIPVIGYVGSAVSYEGLEFLIEALAQLKKRAVPFTFVLVGDGKSIESIRAKVKSLGLESQCRFPGRVPFDQVPRYLSCMDIMPCPRLSLPVTEMVSPLKPLEAMAMGKAVVLSDVSPHKVLAGNNERAKLFDKDDVTSLAHALEHLIHDPSERQRLGRAARAWVEQERTWTAVTNAYSKALTSLQSDKIYDDDALTLRAKNLDEITLGLIADRFTTDTLSSAVKVVPFSPESWLQELEENPVDALFVESSWGGGDGQWHRKVGYYSEEEFSTIEALLEHCRKQGIPSLFWNKEDPVHFDRFRKVASLCDHVFTTDCRRIIPYLAQLGAQTKTASSCPFYASPAIHNPLPSTREWRSTAAYGGTYYGDRYPERTEFMDKIMSAAAPLGLTIYDRQHDDPESPYKYPGGLGGYVAGSLSYEEMIQAYKAHPGQINVNSVLDSPTMFSRRVMEAAACGSPIVSGPGLGMNRYLDGAALIVHSETEAAEALENLLWNPAYRWRRALKGARAVMRAHTAEYRLTQMLRTAGLIVRAPGVMKVAVMVANMTERAAHGLLQQTLRPQVVLAGQWESETERQLEAAGIACHHPRADEPLLLEDSQVLLVAQDAEALAVMEQEDIEDLVWTRSYSPYSVTAFSRESELGSSWPGVTAVDTNVDTGLMLLDARQAETGQNLGGGITGLVQELHEWAIQQTVLGLRKPQCDTSQVKQDKPRKTLLIAGHDLKFIKPFYPYFSKAGFRILLDFWNGHNKHSEATSQRLLNQADVIFCEWMLGNAIWYGNYCSEEKKLVGRLHAQELRSALFDKVPFEAFDKVFFVGPHVFRNAKDANPLIRNKGIIIYNGVDVEALSSVPRKKTNGKVLGLVGIVPKSKRLDRALDILRLLRREDKDFLLRIKGKHPEDYSWMTNREEEMAWYHEQYKRIEEDPLLKDAVFFDPHGNDMSTWYSGINFPLSVSDHESFHFTVADGAASGGHPIVLPWEGADEIYPEDWIVGNVDEAVKRIKELADGGFSKGEKAVAKERFDIKHIAENLIRYLE